MDFDTIDPKGRLDVLIYNLARHGIGMLEQSNNVTGIWDNLKPAIGNIIGEYVTPIELPNEAKILFGILQANYQRGIEGDLK